MFYTGPTPLKVSGAAAGMGTGRVRVTSVAYMAGLGINEALIRIVATFVPHFYMQLHASTKRVYIHPS